MTTSVISLKESAPLTPSLGDIMIGKESGKYAGLVIMLVSPSTHDEEPEFGFTCLSSKKVGNGQYFLGNTYTDVDLNQFIPFYGTVTLESNL